MSQVLTQEKSSVTTENMVEVYARGKWIRVPALEFNGLTIFIRGKGLRMAAIRSEEWLERELEAPELCIEELKKRRPKPWRADIFTFTQKLPAVVPKYRYPMEWESIAAIHLTSFKEWWEKLPQATRKNVRRAEKRGVVVKVRQFDDHLIRDLAELNSDSPIRQGVRNVQYGKSLQEIRKDFSSFLDRSELICAYVGDELVGFLKLVYRGEVASILNLLPKASHEDKRPANALVAKAIERCAARGVSYVTYGLFNYGKKRDSSLREFKIRNGFGEVLVPRFYVPLTAWGVLCKKLGIHRGLIGILPHGVIAAAVRARTKLYNLKCWMSRCSSMIERSNRNRQMGRSTPPAGSNLTSQ